MSKPDYEKLFFNMCGSIALGEGGDCADDVFKALKLAGVELPDYVDDLSILVVWLGKERGTTSLWETPLYDPEEDDCPACKRLKAECDNEYPATCSMSNNRPEED